MPFRVALNTSTIRTTPILDAIAVARDAGFDGVELWINDVYAYIGQGGEVRDIERALDDHGLVVPCIIAARGWGEAEGLEYPLAVDDVKRRLDLAARLGSPWLVATPPRTDCAIDRLAERYRDLLDLGRAAGCLPTFEYISFFASAPSPDHARRVVDLVDDPDATLIVDAFHTWNSGSSLAALSGLPASRMSHYHIDDAPRGAEVGALRDPDRVMPGDGGIDLAAEIAHLREVGYAGWISLELFSEALWREDPLAVARRGRERLATLLGER